MANLEDSHLAAERRIQRFAIGLGALATLVAARWGWRAMAATGAGAALSCLNLRWLGEGVGALAALSAGQADAAKVRIPKKVYFKSAARYALLILAACAILWRFSLPVLPLLAGLLAAVAAVFLELIYEMFRGDADVRVNKPGK